MRLTRQVNFACKGLGFVAYSKGKTNMNNLSAKISVSPCLCVKIKMQNLFEKRPDTELNVQIQ
jgi:hypothetical protein